MLPLPSAILAVATITWARSVSEGRRIARALTSLGRIGLPMAVADRGTDADFTEALRRLPATHLAAPREGLIGQLQASFELAATFQTPFILYVEADKDDFIANRLTAFLDRAPLDAEAGSVLASRSSAAFETYPAMQRYAESVVNTLCSDVIGAQGDYSYGPFVMHRKLLPHIAAIDPTLGWGWRTSTFVAAHRRNLRVAHVIDDHCCPTDQRVEDDAERAHRLRQLSQNILGLIQ